MERKNKKRNIDFLFLIQISQIRDDDDEETETLWQTKTTAVLLQSGKMRFLDALSESIENGIPCLARASLVTISWMSQSVGEVKHLQPLLAGSVLVPQLLVALGQDNTMEERVLASFSLLNLLKCSGEKSQIDKKSQIYICMYLKYSI